MGLLIIKYISMLEIRLKYKLRCGLNINCDIK